MNAVPPRSSAALPALQLDRLLRPRSIAVIGGHAAAEVARQSAKIGFAGDIWPIHTRLSEVAGIRSFRCIADLPGIPDAAFVGVNRHASIPIVAELAALQSGGAVAFASGYAEAGAEGRALQAKLTEAAGAMPLLGPNCYGYLNYLDQALIWPDQFGGHAVPRGVAIITQSGNIGLNITMQRRALPIGYLITLGNQASLNHAAAMHAVLDDPRVTAIGLHMEGLEDPQALAAAMERAYRQRVPVVALKTGGSAAGARITASHTASLSSDDAVVSAFFRRIGLARVNSIPALLEALKLLHVQGPLPGRRITSLSCSGGEAALIADSASAAAIDFMTLTPEAQAEIAATVPDIVAVSNPLDYHTFGWRNRAALTSTFSAMMRAGADLNLLILDFPRPDRCDTSDWDIAAGALEDAANATGQRAAVLATLPEAMPEGHAEALAAHGIVPFFGMDEALQAIAAASATAGQSQSTTLLQNTNPRAPEAISEWQGKQLLRAYGVSVPAGALATDVSAASKAAIAIGFPVVLKAAGKALTHKTELGGVKLDLRNSESVADAAAALLPLTGQVLVESMVADVVAELIVGVARDPVLGLFIMIGSGGIFAELVGDTVTMLMPASRSEIAQALQALRVGSLLRGFRGKPPGDIQAAIDAILAVQEFALAHSEHLQELDVNPLMVRSAGLGCVAADVLMRLTPELAHV